MKIIQLLLVASWVFCVPAAFAEKFCVKGTNPSGKTVTLQRKIVSSSSKCPRGMIELFDTNQILKTGAVASQQVADGTVIESKIANGAVTESKLAAGAVSATKMSSGGASLGSVLTSDGAGGVSFGPISASSLPSSAAKLDADQTFTGDNSFARIQLLTDNGSFRAAPIGELNRDNVAIAWGRVSAAGGLDTNYNVESVARKSAGHYSITLRASTTSGFSLIPVITPEVDQVGADDPPTGLANLRIAASNQLSSGTVFDVFMYNGSGVSVDNDFQFVVFGR